MLSSDHGEDRRDFLRHWVKLVRTCLVKIAAHKAVLRQPAEIRVPAATCAGQLSRAAALRAALNPRCDAEQAREHRLREAKPAAQTPESLGIHSAKYIRLV